MQTISFISVIVLLVWYNSNLWQNPHTQDWHLTCILQMPYRQQGNRHEISQIASSFLPHQLNKPNTRFHLNITHAINLLPVIPDEHTWRVLTLKQSLSSNSKSVPLNKCGLIQYTMQYNYCPRNVLMVLCSLTHTFTPIIKITSYVIKITTTARMG